MERINNFKLNTYIPQNYKQVSAEKHTAVSKSSLLDRFETNVRNSADMTDTLVVPRTIFKGYLGIMSGTVLATLGAFISKPKPVSTALKITGLGLSAYGTWAFVRPYILKDANGVEHKKA